MIIVRMGLGITIQQMSGHSLSTIGSSITKPIAVKMSHFRTARDDLDQVVDIQSRPSMSDSENQKNVGPAMADPEEARLAKLAEAERSASNGTLAI